MKKLKLTAVAVLAAALCLSGCGGTSHSSEATASYKEEAASDSAAGSYDQYVAEEAVAADEESYGEAGDADTGSGDSALRAQDGQKIVYTGSLRMQTLEYDKSAASIRQKIREAGGFSESESERDNNYNWYYPNSRSGNTRYLSITARIPSEKFESFLDSLSGDGKIMSRSVNAENIKAETIEDMITVEARLSEVERQLNVYRTDLAAMDKDVEYSTVYIELEEVKRYTEEVVVTPFGEQVKYAFNDAIDSFKEFCQGIVLFVVRYFPYLILLAIALILVIRASAKSRAKRIAMMSDPEYAKMVNAKARAKAEAEARKRAEKEAKRSGRKGLFGKKKEDAPEENKEEDSGRSGD